MSKQLTQEPFIIHTVKLRLLTSSLLHLDTFRFFFLIFFWRLCFQATTSVFFLCVCAWACRSEGRKPCFTEHIASRLAPTSFIKLPASGIIFVSAAPTPVTVLIRQFPSRQSRPSDPYPSVLLLMARLSLASTSGIHRSTTVCIRKISKS